MELVGFRFEPSEAMLLGYLYNKVSGNKMEMGNMVQECDLYGQKEPWEIWDMFGGATHNKEDLYFFTRLKKKSSTDSRTNRSVGSGTWNDNSDTKEIKHPRHPSQTLGIRKRYRYEDGKPDQVGKWILHEFSLKIIETNMVLCRLRKNQRKQKQV
ncbi:No apical meristem (NAM) protein [Corchorus capsularis]|uniref:No apical meristem (NAM) protein n=1 Tax=Corchorus capsularis TaxID=210143 RepID=A0A1R3KFB0_COCAP|nr:No apical meristem (NAM) protein [Corchorus capsularis]